MKIGNSEPYSTHPLLHATHAEIIALDIITKKLQYEYDLKDIYIFIWKQNASQQIKPVFCCSWCRKMLSKSRFPLKNIVTISDYYLNKTQIYIDRLLSFQSAISKERENVPLMKIKKSKRPMNILFNK